MYLLRSMRSARTYVGYSPLPQRRLRKHNGELRGGAAPVAGRLWELVLIVCGFTSKSSALSFESAWQKEANVSVTGIMKHVARKSR